MWLACYCIVIDNEYYFSSGAKKYSGLVKFNVENNSFEEVLVSEVSFGFKNYIDVGNKLILLPYIGNIVVYDKETELFTETELSANNYEYTLVVGNSVFIYKLSSLGREAVYVYDIIDEQFYSLMYGYLTSVVEDEGFLYLNFEDKICKYNKETYELLEINCIFNV